MQSSQTSWRHDPAESERASQLLRATKPTEHAYVAYRKCVDPFVKAHRHERPTFPFGDETTEVILGFRNSRIFNREFLVAWVDDNALSRFKPSTEAIMMPVEPVLEGLAPFPVVIAPISHRRSQSHKFISVLDHEMVHVCQALRGTWPSGWPEERDALLDEFILYTQIEYEANLLQLARWPNAHTPNAELTIEQWSLLRGYTQALEDVLRSAARGDLDGDLITLVVDVGVHGPRRLERIGCSGDAIEWFANRWLRDVRTAIHILTMQGVDLDAATALHPLIRWLLGRSVPDTR